MQDELKNTLQAINRKNLAAIWEKAKTGDLEDLNGEEKQIAEIMLEHAEEYREELEAAWEDEDYEFDPESDEVNPFLHIAVHAIIENQLANKDPLEAFQFYNAMRKKKASHHGASPARLFTDAAGHPYPADRAAL